MEPLPPDIAAILAFDETAAQFFKRVQQERVLTGLPIIDNHLSLRPGVVLEVAGPPGSGKTELLLSVALHVLLSPYSDPDAWSAAPPPATGPGLTGAAAGGVPPEGTPPPPPPPPATAAEACGDGGEGGGNGPCPSSSSVPVGRSHVVFFDLDGKFDGVRLMQVLQPQVQSAWRDRLQHPRAPAPHGPFGQRNASSQPGADHPWGAREGGRGGGAGGGAAAEPERLLSPDEVTEEVLSRLHLVRCHSSVQLLAALAGLPARMEAVQAAGGCCRLVLIDNVGAHYWRDRAARNVGAPEGGAGQGPGYLHGQHPHQQQAPPLALSLFEVHGALSARLAHLSRRHRLPVIATKTTAVTARGLPEGKAAERGPGPLGWGGVGVAGWGREAEGPVQLQQREFMPMPWQNIVTHRLLLYPRGIIHGPAAAQNTQRAVHELTAILAEMLGPVGTGAVPGPARGGAGGGGGLDGGVGPGSPGGRGGAGGGGGDRGVAQLLVSEVAMVEEW